MTIGPTEEDKGAAQVIATIDTLDGRSVQGRFKLDTGSTEAIGLFANFARGAGLPAPGQPALDQRGVGAGGETNARYFRIASVHLGDQVLRDLPVDAPSDNGDNQDRPMRESWPARSCPGSMLCSTTAAAAWA